MYEKDLKTTKRILIFFENINIQYCIPVFWNAIFL